MTPFQRIMLDEMLAFYPTPYKPDNKGELLSLYELRKEQFVTMLPNGRFELTQKGYNAAMTTSELPK